jgi:hypothetical protein
MSDVPALRVRVDGDLPEDVLRRIGDAVRRTVLYEVASLDLAPTLHEVPLKPEDFPRQPTSGHEPAKGDEVADIGGLIPILVGLILTHIASEE